MESLIVAFRLSKGTGTNTLNKFVRGALWAGFNIMEWKA